MLNKEYNDISYEPSNRISRNTIGISAEQLVQMHKQQQIKNNFNKNMSALNNISHHDFRQFKNYSNNNTDDCIGLNSVFNSISYPAFKYYLK